MEGFGGCGREVCVWVCECACLCVCDGKVWFGRTFGQVVDDGLLELAIKSTSP